MDEVFLVQRVKHLGRGVYIVPLLTLRVPTDVCPRSSVGLEGGWCMGEWCRQWWRCVMGML